MDSTHDEEKSRASKSQEADEDGSHDEPDVGTESTLTDLADLSRSKEQWKWIIDADGNKANMIMILALSLIAFGLAKKFDKILLQLEDKDMPARQRWMLIGRQKELKEILGALQDAGVTPMSWDS